MVRSLHRVSAMRFAPVLLAACVILGSSPALAGNPSAKVQARRVAPGERVYLTPVMKKRQLVGFSTSSARPRRGVLRTLRDGWRVTFAKKAPASALRDTTFWIPGHTLGWKSLQPAMRHFLTNKSNGTVAAVYVAKDGRFHANSPGGRVLADHEVAATKLVTLEFSNPKAAADPKGVEIAAAVRALRRAKGGPGRMRLKVVTHSAGDPQFRAALLDRIDPVADGVKFTGQVAVGSVFMGSWTGNVGATPLGDLPLVKMRKAAAQMAEGSDFLARLDKARDEIDAKIEGTRTDIALEGAIKLTPKLRGKPRRGHGDGFVQSADVSRPGARTFVLRGIDPTPLNHLKQIGYSAVIVAVEQALAD